MPDATPSLWGYLLRSVRELALALSVCFCCLPWSTVYLLPVPCCTTFFVGSRICPRFMSHTHSRDREQASLALCVCVRACESVCHEYACVHYAGLLLYQRKWCRTLTAAWILRFEYAHFAEPHSEWEFAHWSAASRTSKFFELKKGEEEKERKAVKMEIGSYYK